MGRTFRRAALVVAIVGLVSATASVAAVAGSPSRCEPGRDYELVLEQSSWEDARQAAMNAGGHLATISSARENACVRAIADGRSNIWIGATDRGFDAEGVWRWLGTKKGLFWRGAADGTAYGYANWYGGEPNDSGEEEDCAELDGSDPQGRWNDARCDYQRYYIIEY